MPNIETYQNKIEAPRADSAGSEAFEMEGRHIEASYAQAGHDIGGGIQAIGADVEKHEEIQDSASNSKAGAAAFLSLSNQLNDASSKAAADPDSADKHFDGFNQSMEDTIGSIGNDATTDSGRANAERIQNTLRDEFTRQSIGARSAVDGQAVISSLRQTQNTLTQAVSNNPSLLDSTSAYLKQTLQDQLAAHSLRPEESARISAEIGDQAQKALGEAAFTTMAQNNPQAALDALHGGKFANYFNAEDIKVAENYANAQVRAKTENDKAVTEAQKKQDTEEFKTAASQLVGSFVQSDGSLRIPPGGPQQIIKMSLMPGAEPGEIRSLADMTKSVLKDQEKGNVARTDAPTYESFSKKMLDNNLSAQEVYQARADGQLSDKDTGFFLRGMKNLEADPALKDAEKQFNTWAQAQKPAFTHSDNLFGGTDPAGAAKFNQFYQDAHARFQQTYQSKGDWSGLLKQGNPSYLGSIAPQYMTNKKGSGGPPPPHFTSDADVNAFLAKTKNSGVPFIGPDGKQYFTKGR